jgi:UDP-GlcNAc:undecaprenyl-phosphate/decaprenyl-phosphate GlcNAc-1-phosphate transferase
MRTAGVAFVTATATAAALTPIVRHLARRWGLLDHALSSRKVHGKPIPRLGGVAIVCAFFAPLAALYFVDSEVGRRFWSDPLRAGGLFAGGAVIALLGVLDDLRGSGARIKFVVQFAVAALMYWVGFRIDFIANPFGGVIELGMFALPFTMLWIAGVINAMNLIDGLDGLAGGVAFIAVATTFAVAAFRVEPVMLLFTGTLAGAVLGFLFYNFNPATIFMGDTGSMFLGFVLATTAIQTNQKSSTAVALVVPIIALGIPIADTLLAMARRAVRGAPLFSADRGHIHHRLLAMGLSQRQAVIVLYAACALLGGLALAMNFAKSSGAAWYLVALCAVAVAALWRLGYFRWSSARGLIEERKRNAEMRGAVKRLGTLLRTAQTEDEVLSALPLGAAAVGASRASLHDLDRAEAAMQGFGEYLLVGADRISARFNMTGERPGAKHLVLTWEDGRSEVDRGTEIAVEAFCEHLAAALNRVTPEAREHLSMNRTGVRVALPATAPARARRDA